MNKQIERLCSLLDREIKYNRELEARVEALENRISRLVIIPNAWRKSSE